MAKAVSKGQMSMSEGGGFVRYTPKERMEYHAKQSKVGAVDSNGEPLSDFARGTHFAKAEDIGKIRGSTAIKKAAAEGDMRKVTELKANRATFKAQKAAERAAYKASKKSR